LRKNGHRLVHNSTVWFRMGTVWVRIPGRHSLNKNGHRKGQNVHSLRQNGDSVRQHTHSLGQNTVGTVSSRIDNGTGGTRHRLVQNSTVRVRIVSLEQNGQSLDQILPGYGSVVDQSFSQCDDAETSWFCFVS
jgi:hypothetical protein